MTLLSTMRICSTKSPPSSNPIPRGSLAALVAALILNHTLAEAEPDIAFSSGPERVTVVELYTSEGCSSCPPADRWFSKLKREPGLWQAFVPLAFHVDYWDYIGWRDRFASPANSARQRAYARAGGVSTVYTPGFIVNGKEWRGWFRGGERPSSNEPAGTLGAQLRGDTVSVRFAPLRDAAPYTAHVALLGANLASEVSAGENRGRQLLHDFVVLAHVEGVLDSDNGEYKATLGLAARDGSRPRAAAIAVWISSKRDPAPVQAAGTWLPTGDEAIANRR